MKRVLIDASSAILLYKAGLFDDLVKKYKIIMAGSVYHELTRQDRTGSDAFKNFYRNQSFSVVLSCGPNAFRMGESMKMTSLDDGEKDTILQYIKGSGEFIIIDDGRGASYCRDNGIPYINALLFPRILFLCRQISETAYRDKGGQIIRAGRYSPKIIEYAFHCSKKELEFFLP
jgi:hypothetical protein